MYWIFLILGLVLIHIFSSFVVQINSKIKLPHSLTLLKKKDKGSGYNLVVAHLNKRFKKNMYTVV